MPFTRRQFLGTTGLAVAAPFFPVSGQETIAQSRATPSFTPDPGVQEDPQILAASAIEAATAAGASYADVRLTQIREQRFYGASAPTEEERYAVGVRALVNGYWGFMSSALWTQGEAQRLARGSVEQARATGLGRSRTLLLASMPPVVNGQWSMPVTYDPFDIPAEEKLDFIMSADDYAKKVMVRTRCLHTMGFRRRKQTFASSEGSSWRQTTYVSEASFTLSYRDQYHLGLGEASASADFLSPAGKGWEHVYESGLIDQIPNIIADAEQARHIVQVEPYRHEAVFSAQAMAKMLNTTLGPATELDRALGFEANASGTSYLSAPVDMLGTYVTASPVVTITANRSQAGGNATVAWDDEGVVPDEFTLVRGGVLNDYQTTREHAMRLKPGYDRQGRVVRSHGCAYTASAMNITMSMLPNLSLEPGAEDLSFESLVANVKKGIAVISLLTWTDQQQLNGSGQGIVREIVNGKLGRFIIGGEFLFRTPEFWKNVQAVGGINSQRSFGFTHGKGQPYQQTHNTVRAVPALVKNIDLVDMTRKA